jgi:hypothetical protein
MRHADASIGAGAVPRSDWAWPRMNAVICRTLAQPFRGIGHRSANFVTPVAATIVAAIVSWRHAAPLAYAGGSLGALSRSTPPPDHLPATNTARFAARAATRQLAEAAAFDALSNLEGVHLGGARRRDVGAVLMASLGTGLRGAFGFRLLRSRFRGAHRGGCRFRLADDLGRHRHRRYSGCWGHRFGANPFSRRMAWSGVGAAARVRRGNWLRCLRRPFRFFGILRLAAPRLTATRRWMFQEI